MKTSSLAVAALAAAVASAQNILQFGSGQLPACAQSCAVLQNAQTVCMPPAPQPAACFCNSNYLVPLRNGGSLCADTCPNASDQAQIKSWYSSFCVNGGSASYKPSSAGQTTAAATAATSTSAPGATSTSGSETSAAESANSSSSGNGQPPTWWDLHGRWIIMVAVLIIGFGLIIAGGIWWKKRADARRDRASGSTLPTAWGPVQNQHPAAYAASGNAYEKGSAITQPSSAQVNASPAGARNFSKPNRLSRLMGQH